MIIGTSPYELMLNGEAVPGVLVSTKIGSKLIMDAKPVEGGSGKQYQINGHDDADVSFSLRLIDGGNLSKEDALEQVVSMFRRLDDSGSPVIYTLDFPQAQAWRLSGCIFMGMDSTSGSKQEIAIALKFMEYKPEVAVVQEQRGPSSDAAALNPPIPEIADSEEMLKLKRRHGL